MERKERQGEDKKEKKEKNVKKQVIERRKRVAKDGT